MPSRIWTDNGGIPISAANLNAMETDIAAAQATASDAKAKQAVKCVRLETGKWVWDLAGATHFVIPDHTGALIVRATAQPVPAATPALDW